MLNPGGCLILDGPEGHKEFDTFTCSHCNCVVILWGHKLQGGFCIDCNHRICDACIVRYSCNPFIKRIELLEEKYYKELQAKL